MNFKTLVPELTVTDIKVSLSFYQGLGFKLEYQREAEKAVLLRGDGRIVQRAHLLDLAPGRPGGGEGHLMP